MTSLEIDNPAIIFVIGLVISTIIIFIVTKLFRGRKHRESIHNRSNRDVSLGCYILSLWSWLIGNSGWRHSLAICTKRDIWY